MVHNTVPFLNAAWEAANAAGTIIRNKWQQPQRIDYKGAIDLVTDVDRESERCIVEILQRNFPDHAILAEEETDRAGNESEYRWIIDPLDGTTNFAHGFPQFCVSVALEHTGEIILGLVYDPLRRECFRAMHGGGATLNGTPIRVSKIGGLERALLATGFPYDHHDHADEYLTYFKSFMKRTQGIRRAGSAALDLCYVACGRFDGFWELKLKPWDIAAGALIVREAGGIMSDFSGHPFSITGAQTLASNGVIHEEMLGILREVCAMDSATETLTGS
jgi:myo-inositol-1(or 4)-monophosphatase